MSIVSGMLPVSVPQYTPAFSIPPMTGLSIKWPFHSGYLMDIFRCIERQEIAHS
jgi:hypothetical protein